MTDERDPEGHVGDEPNRLRYAENEWRRRTGRNDPEYQCGHVVHVPGLGRTNADRPSCAGGDPEPPVAALDHAVSIYDTRRSSMTPDDLIRPLRPIADALFALAGRVNDC